MTTANITLNVREINQRASVIDISGEVTSAAENGLMDAYNQITTPIVIMNFRGLEYMNSSGIGLLVTLLIRANRDKKKLLAVELKEHYQHIFELTRLNEAIRIYDTEAEALAAQ